MPSWIPGTGGSSSAPASTSTFGGGGGWGAAYPFSAAGNRSGNTGGRSGFLPSMTSSGGGGPSKWVNMDTQQVSYLTGELTGENSAFAQFGFELTRQQRLMGFVGCVIAGFVISLIGTLLLLIASYVLFAILYSVGFLVSLTGTGFLIGFGTMIKQMFKPVRVVATIIMFAAFAMVWISAFAIRSAPLAIVFCVVLYLSYLWFALSFVPYARSLVKRMFSKVIGG
ncbi:SFT2-domain-containing protein [Tilletiaria anomala UBC 951]|uniref:Protein transport protein SFT2 n=1 Tax=Tilletiaria anomala (strain ATCC 24038 / CBS 436.72 / UBC 951) TaxID=1037660 RepID=A0A066VZ87_TILAU|nr:SFT2-domain-containing protein [Tilletiaria anomala UBC 951]KDN44134.1 SFT2-domain-containing protein [Tilletiaria anomala UBC 951]